MGNISKLNRNIVIRILTGIGFAGFLIWSAAIPFAQMQTTRFTGIGMFMVLGSLLLQIPFGFDFRPLAKPFRTFLMIWTCFALWPLVDCWRWQHIGESLLQLQIRLPMLFLPYLVWQLSPGWPKGWVSIGFWVAGGFLLLNMAWSLRLGPQHIWSTLHSDQPANLGLGMHRPYYGLLIGSFSFLQFAFIPRVRWFFYPFIFLLFTSFLVLILAKFALISLILTAISGLFIWAYLFANKGWMKAGIVLGLGLLLGLSLLAFLQSNLWNDIRSSGEIRYETVQKTYSNSANTRLIIWKASWKLLTEGQTWIWGLGTENTQDKLDEIYLKVNPYVYEGHFSPHNTLIFIALQYGIIGLAIFLFGFFRLLLLFKGKDSLVPILVLIFIFLCSQTEIFISRELGVHFILWASIVLIFRQAEKNSGGKP